MDRRIITTRDLQPKQIIKALTAYANNNGLALALWRAPNSTKSELIIDTNGVTKINDQELEELPAGFMFSPFSENGQKLLINANIKFSTNDDQFESLEAPGQITDDITDFLQIWSEPPATMWDFPAADKVADSTFTSKEEFQAYVDDCIRQIEDGVFQKVVPARAHRIELGSNYDLLALFDQLAGKYANAFVSLVVIPGVGTWIGATPELLLSTDENDIFTTVSLAGTQRHRPEVPLLEVAWTQKEIEEQAMVGRYIINCFKTIRLREFEEDGPKTAIAGNLVHLKTTFKVDMRSTNFLNLGSVMLKLLHPTSAVCGMPKAAAMPYIESMEPFSREFFSGYLGPVNIASQTSLFVNLRCMQVMGSDAIIYAGAGVTGYSDPEKEWEETELKCNTLLNIIYNEGNTPSRS